MNFKLSMKLIFKKMLISYLLVVIETDKENIQDSSNEIVLYQCLQQNV